MFATTRSCTATKFKRKANLEKNKLLIRFLLRYFRSAKTSQPRNSPRLWSHKYFRYLSCRSPSHPFYPSVIFGNFIFNHFYINNPIFVNRLLLKKNIRYSLLLSLKQHKYSLNIHTTTIIFQTACSSKLSSSASIRTPPTLKTS